MRFRSANNRTPFEWSDVPQYKRGPQSEWVSVIVPFGSAQYQSKLEHCLQSLRHQQHIQKRRLDIVLTCIQKEQHDLSDIVDLAEEYDARLVVGTKAYTHFPLALARNVGARAAAANKLCFVDADIVLDPEAIAWSLEVPNRLVAILTAYMPQQYDIAALTSGDTKYYRAAVRKGLVNVTGFGGYLMVDRTIFESVGGYDEAYDIGWGAEDNDFVDRVIEKQSGFGLKFSNLTHRYGLVNAHQWHERIDHSKEPSTIANRQRYAQISVCEANGGKWGMLDTQILVPSGKKKHKNKNFKPVNIARVGVSNRRCKLVNKRKHVTRPKIKGKALAKLIAEKEDTGFPTLSIIISCSDDRYAPRLIRCLHAIRGQIGVRHQDIEVVISCVHNQVATGKTKRLREIANQYNAVFVEGIHHNDVYNLSLSRNFGAVRANGEVLCFLDVDIVMDPEMVRYALMSITRHNYVVSLVTYMPRDVDSSVYQSTDIKRFRQFAKNGRLGKRGLGGCVFMYASMHQAVGGYDEAFVGWGGEDNDMCARLGKLNIEQINLTNKFGLVAIHQWHPQNRRHDESDYRAKNWERLDDERLPIVRNPQIMGGYSAGITTMVPHHPMRPMACLKKCLKALEMAVGMREHTVDLYIQGEVNKNRLPKPENYSFNLQITQYDTNMGLSVPTKESIEKFLQSDQSWWSKVDDDILMPKDGLEKLIGVIEHEDRLGEIEVGACQMTTGAGSWVHKPRVFVLSTEIVEGKPVLLLKDGHIVERSNNGVQWRVADASGWGSTVFHRRVFEAGVRPDTQYFLGVVDIDVFYQMKMLGMRVALVNSPACTQLVQECYNESYKAVRYSPKIIRQSGRRFSDKWGVYHKRLVEYKK